MRWGRMGGRGETEGRGGGEEKKKREIEWEKEYTKMSYREIEEKTKGVKERGREGETRRG